MNPTRILQVVTTMNRGGLETMLMNYYRQIDRKHIQFDFMVHRSEKGQYDEEILKLGGRIFHMPQIKPGNYRIYFKLLDEFFQEHSEYKIVHSHINENSSFVLRAAKKAGIPIRIAHSHTSNLGIDYKLPFRLYARKSMKNNPSSYFACSTNAGKWLFGNNVIKTNQVLILKNAINIEEFKFNTETRRIERDLLEITDQLVIGHVGRFHESKNHDFLINVFNEIHKKYSNSVLLLIGEGNTRRSIENKVKKLGLTSSVKFLGIRTDISNLLQAMDVFLFPSFFEGAPVALIEAQAAGLKCVISDSISIDSDLTGNVEFLSLKKPIQIWAEKILSLSYEHTDTSAKLKEHGYDIVTMAKVLSEYYIDNIKEKSI